MTSRPLSGPLARLLGNLGMRPPARRKGALDGLVLMISAGDSPIPVKITVRSQARRMVLRLDRTSREGRLTVPKGVKRELAERFLADHTGWLRTRLAALPARIAFTPGTSIPLRGVPHRIEHQLSFRGVTSVADGEDGPVIRVHGALEAVEARVLRFLKAQALSDFSTAARLHAAKIGVSLGRISIKDTRSRWGSCAASGDLAFSWRLILAPPSVLSYLAAHEVAHRLEMNHSARYWQGVAKLDPAWEAAETWLKRHGAGLHAYGTLQPPAGKDTDIP